MLSSHNEMKLEINNRKIFRKCVKMLILNNTLLNNQSIKEENTREIRKYFVISKTKNKMYQNLWDATKWCSKRNS